MHFRFELASRRLALLNIPDLGIERLNLLRKCVKAGSLVFNCNQAVAQQRDFVHVRLYFASRRLALIELGNFRAVLFNFFTQLFDTFP